MKRKDGKFVVIKEKTGYTLNMNETFANFKKAVEAEKHQFELDVVKDMHSQVPMKMDRRFRHMVVESARYLLLCIMQLSVQN